MLVVEKKVFQNCINEEEHRSCCGAYNIESGTEVLLARLKSLVRGIGTGSAYAFV